MCALSVCTWAALAGTTHGQVICNGAKYFGMQIDVWRMHALLGLEFSWHALPRRSRPSRQAWEAAEIFYTGECLPDDNKFCSCTLQEQRPANTLPATASNLVPDPKCSSLTQPHDWPCTVRFHNFRMPCRLAPSARPHGWFTRADRTPSA